jgi:hypothetical protein
MVFPSKIVIARIMISELMMAVFTELILKGYLVAKIVK